MTIEYSLDWSSVPRELIVRFGKQFYLDIEKNLKDRITLGTWEMKGQVLAVRAVAKPSVLKPSEVAFPTAFGASISDENAKAWAAGYGFLRAKVVEYDGDMVIASSELGHPAFTFGEPVEFSTWLQHYNTGRPNYKIVIRFMFNAK
jgi:hypothetical protein